MGVSSWITGQRGDGKAAKSCNDVLMLFKCFIWFDVLYAQHKQQTHTKGHHSTAARYRVSLCGFLFSLISIYSSVVLSHSSPLLAQRQESMLVWGDLSRTQLRPVQEQPLQSALQELQERLRPHARQLPSAHVAQRWQTAPTALLTVLLHRWPTKMWHNRLVPEAADAPRGQIQHNKGAALVDQKTVW